MATWAWDLRDTNAAYQTIDATGGDILGFYGSSFDDPIEVNAYQSSIHFESSVNVHECTVYHGVENKWISSSEVDLGAGTVNLSTAGNNDAVLRVTFNHTDSVTNNTTFWAYDATTEATAPVNITFQCAEAVSDSNWTNAGGSGSAMSLDDNTQATDHFFYILLSAMPTATGDLEAFKLKLQLTYQ